MTFPAPKLVGLPSTAATQGGALRAVHRPYSTVLSPVEVLRRLRSRGAVLLESKTDHPDARFSYVAFHPQTTVEVRADHVIESGNGSPPARRIGPPLETLRACFRRYQSDVADVPFIGGWIGFLSHEASSVLLNVTPSPALPPARPEFPLGLFRFYPDVVVFDHANGVQWLFAHEFPGASRTAARRLDEVEVELARPIQRPLAARARDDPVESLDGNGFRERVEALQRWVRDGDCFQVNLAASFAFPWSKPPTDEALVGLYEEYSASNPGAWAAFFDGPGFYILSSSPERLADAREGRLALRPIAGTRPRGRDPGDDARLAEELRTDVKERAEHAMLVDLARNDAAAVCRPGTVWVPNLAGVERYRHVMHLVSEVEGELEPDKDAIDVLAAVFPGGTVTGCPKRRAVERIAEIEPGPRGPYTGTLGYVSLNGNHQWNLLIRTLVATPTHLIAHAGCGIVQGSRPEAELDELRAKARAQVEAALGRATAAKSADGCGRVEPGPSWRPATPLRAPPGRRVLLIDFDDSFVQNLADYCRRLGAEATVHSARAPADDAWQTAPTHVILSPGPGRPEDFPAIARHLENARLRGTPVLGVCLGHQALAAHAGARVGRHTETVHGRAGRIHKTVDGEADAVLGGWRGENAARYHSLAATELPDDLVPLARLQDGTCMALRHRDRPWWGLQFHPESLLTEDGLDLLKAFLEVDPHG